jgi:hypothetical protein
MTDIFIPIMRTERIPKIVANLRETTLSSYRICFIVEKADFEQLRSPEDKSYIILLNKRTPTYSGAINSAFEQTDGDYFFTGADDLEFQKDWLEIALKKMSRFDVVGTNDLMNIHVLRGEKATHYLVKREYINKNTGTMDKSFPVLYEYNHNYCDWEFIETAKKRGVFTPCLESVVKHNHWTKGRSKRDEVYEKGDLTKNEDLETFNQRRYLWK